MGGIRVTLEVVVAPGELRGAEQRIYDAVDRGVERTVQLGERVARRLAPVRKVTELTRRARPRALSKSEISSIPAAIRKNYTPAQLSSLQTVTPARRAQQSVDAPEVTRDEISGIARLTNRNQTSFLTQRGRAELREAGRNERTTAIVSRLGGGSLRDRNIRRTLGGRLRSEIRFRVLSEAPRVVYLLESPTEYAPFVEFPTSRTAAQPYMRPAREAMRPALHRNTVTELKRAGFEVY